MRLSEFLKKVEHGDLADVDVCKFQVADSVKEVPVHFSSLFFARLKHIAPVSSIDAELQSLSAMKAQLEVSFLGNRLFYWVKNVDALDQGDPLDSGSKRKSKKTWNSYVQSYEGPHCIFFFESGKKAKKTVEKSESDSPESMLIVELPEHIDAGLYRTLATFLYPHVQLDEYFSSQLFFTQESVSLDEACLMMAYQSVVGRKCESFFKQWFSRLIVPEKSFFTLSQYLFARQPKSFLQQWKACKADYPEEFWVAYWSEQVWQATLFVARARKEGIVQAKKGTYRLPFSFINKDWQSHSVESLAQAHNSLYLLDYNLKNGGGSHGLELWYHTFLLPA